VCCVNGDLILIIYPSRAKQSKYIGSSIDDDNYNTNAMGYPPLDYMYTSSPERFCSKTNVKNKYDTFNRIKHAIDLSILQLDDIGIRNPINLKIKMKPFDCVNYKEDHLKKQFSFFTPTLICLAYVATFLSTISSIIMEKETKMKVN
jgi:hypothetical protein